MGVLSIVNAGVLTGSEAKKLFAYAKENNFAIPAVNVVGTDSVNAVLEAAAKVKSPIIIQRHIKYILQIGCRIGADK